MPKVGKLHLIGLPQIFQIPVLPEFISLYQLSNLARTGNRKGSAVEFLLFSAPAVLRIVRYGEFDAMVPYRRVSRANRRNLVIYCLG